MTVSGSVLELLSVGAALTAAACLVLGRAPRTRCAQAVVMAVAMGVAALPGRPAAAVLVSAAAVLASAPLSVLGRRGAPVARMDVHRSVAAVAMSGLILLAAGSHHMAAMTAAHHSLPVARPELLIGIPALASSAAAVCGEAVLARRAGIRGRGVRAAIEAVAMGVAVAAMTAM